VPTIARARNIICSTLAALPLEQYSKLDGSHMGTPAVINQPDPRVPGSAIYAWLAEDLLFHGVGYGQVLEQYGDTGRVRAWTRVAPDRVTTKLNSTNRNRWLSSRWFSSSNSRRGIARCILRT